MANRHRKGCSTSLIIRAIQIKTTRKHNLTLVRITNIKKKKSTDNNCQRGCGEKREPYTPLLVGMQVRAATMENSMEVPQKTKNKSCHMIQQFYSWKYIQRKL